MKNTKRFNVIAIAIITAGIAFAMTLTACPTGGGGTSAATKCTCPDKNHLAVGESCNCGGSDCNCTVKEYGKIADGIPVYRTADVTDEQAVAAYANILAGYNGLTEGAIKSRINTTKVSAIHITNGSDDCVADGSKHIIKVAYDNDDYDMKGLLNYFSNNYLAMLFKQFDNSKEAVYLALGKTRAVKIA